MVTWRACSNRVWGTKLPSDQKGGRDARLDHRQPDADGDQCPVTPDRATDLGPAKESVQGGPPLRTALFDQREDEGVDDLVDALAGLQPTSRASNGVAATRGAAVAVIAGKAEQEVPEAVADRHGRGEPGHRVRVPDGRFFGHRRVGPADRLGLFDVKAESTASSA
jgi:hypothetical protein